MRLFVFEIGTVLLLGGTLMLGGGLWLILTECAAVYWLGKKRTRNLIGGERY